MARAMPCPCSGPSTSLRKMRRSIDPWSSVSPALSAPVDITRNQYRHCEINQATCDQQQNIEPHLRNQNWHSGVRRNQKDAGPGHDSEDNCLKGSDSDVNAQKKCPAHRQAQG